MSYCVNSDSRFQIKNKVSGRVVEAYTSKNNLLRLVDPNQLNGNYSQRAFYVDNMKGNFRHNITNGCLTSVCK